jgi:hypothetical protein
VSQLGLAPVPISVTSSSGIGTNAKNLRGGSRDIRNRMSHTRQLREPARISRSLRNAKIQVTCCFDDGLPISLIRVLSIIETTPNKQFGVLIPRCRRGWP